MLVAALESQAGTFRRAAAHHSAGLGCVPARPAPQRFDLVFLDPPYALPVEPLLALLPPWLSDRALAYVERPRTPGLPAVPDGDLAASAATRVPSSMGCSSFAV